MNRILFALIGLLLAASALEAAPVKPGLYKGSVTVVQTLTESGVKVKRTFSISGRIRDNGTFVWLGAPVGMANDQISTRGFTGNINFNTALVTLISGTDINGFSVSEVNLQASYAASTLTLVWTRTINLSASYGESVTKRTFVLTRTGP